MNQNTVIALAIGAVVLVGLVVLAGSGFFSTQEPPSSTTTPDTTQTQNPPTSNNPNENPETITLGIGLIALEDNGASGPAIGCNDSVVLIEEEVPYTVATLEAALSRLLSLQGTTHEASGLYNALGDSDLAIDELAIEGGVATVELTGSLSLGGVCDNPRVSAQLVETVLQFATVDEAEIFINGEPLAEALSQQ